MNRYPLIACILSLLLTGYLCFALPFSARLAADDTFAGCRISIADSLESHFITQADVSHECGDIMQWISSRRRADLDLNALENSLRASDRIEKVNVCVLNNGMLAIDVTPMVPVARVFADDSSYYINSVGKKISASPRYHVDVPVVVGHFTTARPPERLLPLLRHIAADPALDALVSTVRQSRAGDIYLIPTIRGHVVNFGDTSMVADKFSRLGEFYRRVLPVKGWETYDTISVKWRGQIVATRRDKALSATSLASAVEEFDDIDDLETIIAQSDSI